jgi:hypothetical protein
VARFSTAGPASAARSGGGGGGGRPAPDNEVANALARLIANPATKEQGLALQRQMQGGISSEAMDRAGLQTQERPGRSLMQRGAGALFGALDILDRPSQAVIRTLGSLTGGTKERNPLGGFFGGLTGRGDRASFQQGLGIQDHEQIGGFAGGALNLAGTIATDPLTYLTFGASSAAKRGLLTISSELGEDAAEQVARRGLSALNDPAVIASVAGGTGKAARTAGDDLLGTLRKLPEFADGQLDKIAGEIQGGIKVGLPFQRPTTMIPGERLRAPLRGSASGDGRRALFDPIRPGVRSGSARAGTEAPIRAAIRGNSAVRGFREQVQTFGNIGSTLGRNVSGTLRGMAGRAQAAVGATEEIIARTSAILKDTDIDDALKARILAASERSFKPAGDLLDQIDEAETLDDIFAEFAQLGTEEGTNVAKAVVAISDLRTRSRDARMTPVGRDAPVRETTTRVSTPEPAGPSDPHRVRNLGNQPGERVSVRTRTLRDTPGLDTAGREEAAAVYKDMQSSVRAGAKTQADEGKATLETLMGDHTVLQAPPAAVRKRIPGTDRFHWVDKATGRSLGGEWDWWFNLSQKQRNRLKNSGVVAKKPKGGALPEGSTPDLISGRIAEAVPGVVHGDEMEWWMREQFRLADLRLTARGRAPLGATPYIDGVDNWAVDAVTSGSMSDDAAIKILGQADDEARRFAKSELPAAAVHGKNVWDMELDEIFAEADALEASLKGVKPVSDEFGDVWPAAHKKAAARLEELVAPFAKDTSGDWDAIHRGLKESAKRAFGPTRSKFRRTLGSGGRVGPEGPVPGPRVVQEPRRVPSGASGPPDGTFPEGRFPKVDNADGTQGAANPSFKAEPGKGPLGIPDVVPTIFTDEARKAFRDNPSLRSRADDIKGPLGGRNDLAKERIKVTKADEFFETDPFKIAQIQNINKSRKLTEDQFYDELDTLVDPTTGEKLMAVDTGQLEISFLQGKDSVAVKRVGPFPLGNRQVWAHPELVPFLKRMDAQLFNPKVQGPIVQAFDDILGMWKGFATVPVWFGTGFHARNMLGNIRLNSIEGVKPASYRSALNAQQLVEKTVQRVNKSSLLDDDIIQGIIKGSDGAGDTTSRLTSAFGDRDQLLFEDALSQVAKEDGVSDVVVQRILTARREGVLNSGFFDADLRGKGLIENIRGGDKQSRLEWIKTQLTDPRQSIAIKQGAAIGGMVENNARLAHYFSKLDEGLTFADAASSVKRTLFDYSELTLTEQNVFKRIVPFYTFMRKNTPVQLENLMTNPRRFLTERRLLEGIASTGVSDDKALPEWALNDGQVPLPGFVATFLAGGNTTVMGSLDLPTDAAFETIEPILEFAAWALPDAVIPEEFQASRAEFFQGIVGLPGGGVTEGAKLFIEDATETDLFTGAPLDNQGKRQLFERWSNLVPLVTKGRTLVEGILDVKRVDDPAAVDSGITVMRAILGVNLTVVGPKRERDEMLSRLDELDRALRKARDRGVELPTITELRDAGVIPGL